MRISDWSSDVCSSDLEIRLKCVVSNFLRLFGRATIVKNWKRRTLIEFLDQGRRHRLEPRRNAGPHAFAICKDADVHWRNAPSQPSAPRACPRGAVLSPFALLLRAA